MAEFFNMGGYALYVWGSFCMTALCMIVEPILVRGRARNIRRRIARIVRLEEGVNR